MDRAVKLTIKCKIMMYPRMQKEIANQIADISEKIGGGGTGGGKTSAKQVKGWDIALIGVMSKEDYLWCKAIEDTIAYFKERGRDEVTEAIEALYWKHRCNADGFAIKYNISRATVYNLVGKFEEIVHKYAIKHGLVVGV